jgi:hypothetical protein
MKPIKNFRLYALTTTETCIHYNKITVIIYSTWPYLFNLIDPVSLNVKQITPEKVFTSKYAHSVEKFTVNIEYDTL